MLLLHLLSHDFPLCTYVQVAKIEQISSRKANGSSVITISWYYRPEEAHGGRKVRTGQDGLRHFWILLLHAGNS